MSTHTVVGAMLTHTCTLITEVFVHCDTSQMLGSSLVYTQRHDHDDEEEEEEDEDNCVHPCDKQLWQVQSDDQS